MYYHTSQILPVSIFNPDRNFSYTFFFFNSIFEISRSREIIVKEIVRLQYLIQIKKQALLVAKLIKCSHLRSLLQSTYNYDQPDNYIEKLLHNNPQTVRN